MLVGLAILKVAWRSVSVMNGELCVTRCGTPLMPVWSAGNWDCLLQVIAIVNLTYMTLCKIFIAGSQALTASLFGQGVGRIWLDNVQCTRSEKVLMNCTASSRGNNSCTHAQNAGVRCSAGKIFSLMERTIVCQLAIPRSCYILTVMHAWYSKEFPRSYH